ncbi:unnamed protein product [Rotaria sp. Silwood2]|nr:unnamed protein product [Rotaria sp. Silwood2]CAF4247066.1 unnamed protein product [Rotaria sp. Silwood2]
MPNLSHLTIQLQQFYLNGHDWQRIIVDNIPKIKIFHLKMNINFYFGSHKQKQIDILLDSFRTQFWLEERQWFVRCDWNSFESYDADILYTLPYAFGDFIYHDKCNSKSTCPNETYFRCYDLLDQLISIDIRFLPMDLSFTQLQMLLDRSTR